MSDERYLARVSFRIYSPTLEPEVITKNIGISPSHAHRKGEHPHGNSKYKAYEHGMWLLSSGMPENIPLVEHLAHLLIQLEPSKFYLRRLSEETTMEFLCKVSSPGGLQLPASILKQIAITGATLSMEVFLRVPEEDGFFSPSSLKDWSYLAWELNVDRNKLIENLQNFKDAYGLQATDGVQINLISREIHAKNARLGVITRNP